MEFWSNETPYGLGLKIEGDYSQEIIHWIKEKAPH